MDSSDIIITGMGAVTPHGSGVDALWHGLIEGRAAFAPITLFDASMFRNPLGGVAPGYTALEAGAPCRSLRMLHDAAHEALCDAFALPLQTEPAAVKETLARAEFARYGAIVAGTNFGGMKTGETALVEGAADATKASLDGYLFGNYSQAVGERYGIHGPRLNLSLSCASGAAAVGLAFDLLRLGRADFALACGYDELSLYVYAGLSALRAITPETIRPFDQRRKGTLFSEGAAVVVLETAEHAHARKAPHAYARVLGRALNNDAYHMTAPETEALGIKALMRAALADAHVAPEQIDHLNLHATGTPYNDAIETKAVHEVFGARGREIPVCSVKSSIGHTMGAAGIVEIIAAVQTLREGKVPPVLGLDPAQQDPACALNAPTGTALVGDFRTILKTSYGFGGTNAAVVIGK